MVCVEVVVNKVRLPGWRGPVLNAAIWLREHLGIPEYEAIDQPFCEYFGCTVEIEYIGPGFPLQYAVFDGRAATAFILRWS